MVSISIALRRAREYFAKSCGDVAIDGEGL